MQYPLSEEIGAPELFVGRKKEFAMIDDWVKLIPKRLGKSKAFFSRKKGGKTALVQRLFNRLWCKNGPVVPIFFSIADSEIWLPDFAIHYYQTFASQYISFLERIEKYVENPLSLDDILEYGKNHDLDLFEKDVHALIENESKKRYDLMWKTACSAPKRFASFLDTRFLVIIDEFQFLSKYITIDQENKIPKKTLPGSYHQLAESKIAPMLITGSYTSWLNNIIQNHLEGGRVSKHFFSPYLEPEEGLCAVKVYSKFFNQKTTKETQKQINTLCKSDPFFISCVIQSKYEDKDLQTTQGVINTIHYEISNRLSDMSRTWREYIDNTLEDINNINAKRILLHMSKDPDRVWIPKELIETLQLEISQKEVLDRLKKLEKADLIEQGVADIEFKGLNDGTLHLILRSRYGREIDDFEPDIRVDFRKTLKLTGL
jgi:predicted transcriptional regulator